MTVIFNLPHILRPIWLSVGTLCLLLNVGTAIATESFRAFVITVTQFMSIYVCNAIGFLGSFVFFYESKSHDN